MTRWQEGPTAEPPEGADRDVWRDYARRLQAFVEARLGPETDAAYLVRTCGGLMGLTPMEAAVFALLHRALPAGLTVKQIAARVWAHDPEGGPGHPAKMVHVYLHKIREKQADWIKVTGEGWYVPARVPGFAGCYCPVFLTRAGLAEHLAAAQADKRRRVA